MTLNDCTAKCYRTCINNFTTNAVPSKTADGQQKCMTQIGNNLSSWKYDKNSKVAKQCGLDGGAGNLLVQIPNMNLAAQAYCNGDFKKDTVHKILMWIFIVALVVGLLTYSYRHTLWKHGKSLQEMYESDRQKRSARRQQDYNNRLEDQRPVVVEGGG